MKTTVQFMLSKFAIAWMFALVTINFNRVAIFDLGFVAVIVTTMIGIYPFFGLLQPYFGRITSRYPILGYRRSPYLLIGLMVGALVFPPLPIVLNAMTEGALWAIVAGFVLFAIFGAMIALMANTYLDLVAECTTEETRSKVFAAAWTGQTAIIVVWAFIFRLLMPTYSPESMQFLYNLTPFVVLVLGILSIWGLETRLSLDEVAQIRQTPRNDDAVIPIQESLGLLRNPTARMFFLFILLTFPAIFLQDAIQEVFAGEVLGMTVGQSTIIQQIFNGTVTIGMGATAALGAKALGFSIPTPSLPSVQKRRIITFGGICAGLSLGLQAVSAYVGIAWLFLFAIGLFGITAGIFTFAAVTMMSDMTIQGQTGRYLGLWSIAQAIGLGLAFLVGGGLHTLLVGSGWFNPAIGYALIFSLEGVAMFSCVWMVRGTTVEKLQAGHERLQSSLQPTDLFDMPIDKPIG
ncbi:MAG: BCD family MFS transporter [Chloroflexota bacterium]